MKNVITLAVLAAFILLTSCKPQIDLEAEKEKVIEVLSQFIEASQNHDMEMLSKIYAHDDDMVIFGTHADERIVGWENLKKVMEEQFDSSGNSTYAVSNQVVKMHSSGKVAWFSEIIDWELEYQGEQVIILGLRVTGVMEKRNDNWVIVQLHYSIPAS